MFLWKTFWWSFQWLIKVDSGATALSKYRQQTFTKIQWGKETLEFLKNTRKRNIFSKGASCRPGVLAKDLEHRKREAILWKGSLTPFDDCFKWWVEAFSKTSKPSRHMGAEGMYNAAKIEDKDLIEHLQRVSISSKAAACCSAKNNPIYICSSGIRTVSTKKNCVNT